MGGAEQQVGPQLQGFDVEIGLVKAVEEHQPIGSGRHQSGRQGAEVGEKGAEFHRQRQGHLGAHLGDDLLHLGLDRGAAEAGIGGNGINIQFDRLGAGLLDLAGQLHPAAGPKAIEAGDHRHPQPGPGLADQIEIGLGTAVAEGPFRQVAEGLGIAVATSDGVAVQLQLVALDLLFKQGMEHDRAGPGQLERLELGQAFAQGRRRPHHQRVAQLQAQVGGGEIDAGHGFTSWPGLAPGPA